MSSPLNSSSFFEAKGLRRASGVQKHRGPCPLRRRGPCVLRRWGASPRRGVPWELPHRSAPRGRQGWRGQGPVETPRGIRSLRFGVDDDWPENETLDRVHDGPSERVRERVRHRAPSQELSAADRSSEWRQSLGCTNPSGDADWQQTELTLAQRPSRSARRAHRSAPVTQCQTQHG